MPQLFNKQDIQAISDDLKVFLNAVKGSIDKLDYLNTHLPVVENSGKIEIDYRNENIDIIPEVENAVIFQMENYAKKELNIQLHLSPASYIVFADRLFLQQIFFRLINNLLEACENRSVISVYVTDGDEKCNIEVLNQKAPTGNNEVDDYFKKYRINNPVHTAKTTEGAVLPVYKKMVEDMKGDLSFSFDHEKQLYFRLKFPLV
jgi:K+-sensing histidine kinase KdpD